jgi:hypothetical protein
MARSVKVTIAAFLSAGFFYFWYCNVAQNKNFRIQVVPSSIPKASANSDGSTSLRSDPSNVGKIPVAKEPKDILLTASNLSGAKLNPGDAKALIERCELEVKDVSQRSSLCALIIGSLCKQGLTSEAWSLIDQSPGYVRSSEMYSFFMHSKSLSPDRISELVSGLSDPSDRGYAASGLANGRPEILLQIDSSIIPGDSIEVSRTLANSISSKLLEDPNWEHGEDFLNRMMQLAAVGKLEAGSLLNVMNSAQFSNSFSQWSAISNLADTFDAKSLEAVRVGLAKEMVVADAVKAMNVICTDPSTMYSYPVLSGALTTMFKTDPAGASSWVATTLDHLEPATSQRVISSLAQIANQNLEFDTSRMWANKILNSDVRKQLLDQVSKREAEKANKN